MTDCLPSANQQTRFRSLNDSSLKYRRDIDGLRAIAVVCVVLYHAFPELLSGGFIGVDVFFVISGYLISSIISDGIQQNRFSLTTFYVRRILRIFPALILVLCACAWAGWYLLLPDEFRSLGIHIASSAAFFSNITLWRESGYFDKSAELKPLLHLWSLAVEEQFYILWPLVILLIAKRRLNLFYATSSIAILSFLMNIICLNNSPSMSFFWPQSRFWELLSGAILAWGMANTKLKFESNLRSLLGALLLIIGLIFITNRTPFPGYWATCPVLATALIISAGPQAWLNRVILSQTVLVWTGLISFPLYLWHWPLLSLGLITEGKALSGSARISLIGASLMLAWLTFQFVEKPFRKMNRRKFIVPVLTATLISTGTLGFLIYKWDGLPSREFAKLTDKMAGYDFFRGKSEDDFWKETCFNLTGPASDFLKNNCALKTIPNGKKVLLLGDSHAAYLSLGLRPFALNHGINFYQFTSAACTPLSEEDKRERCRDINRLIENQIRVLKPDVLIFFANYLLYPAAKNKNGEVPYSKLVEAKINEFSALKIKQIFVLGQMPTWIDSLPHSLARNFLRKRLEIPSRTYEGVNQISLAQDDELHRIHFSSNVRYLSMKNLLCSEQGCITTIGTPPEPIVYDYGHLTKAGAEYVTDNFLSKYLLL